MAYVFIISGLVVITLIFEPVITEELRFNLDQLFNRHHTLPKIITSADIDAGQLSENGSQGETRGEGQSAGFGSLAFGSSETIVPVSTDFGIVIEKINANARIIPNVDPGNERDYIPALSRGVAHAKGTVFPGQKGNIYLFSHSADAPWNIVRYNAIFYLLGKLEPGDRVILFYKGRRFDYTIFDKTVVGAKDTDYLTRTYDESVLTLQTCDPPGTLANRLIVRAKLAGSGIL